MSLPTSPDPIYELIAGYVLGTLEPEEAAEFEQRLANNPELAQELAQVQQALELAYAPPDVAPPAHLRDRILAAVASPNDSRSNLANPLIDTSTEPPIETLHYPSSDIAINAKNANETISVNESAKMSIVNSSDSRFWHRSTFSWGNAFGVAAAALIVALGIANYRLWTALQTAQTAQTEPTPSVASDRLTYSLQGTELADRASATLVVDRRTLEATLAVENLPPLPADKVYVLWTVVGSNAPLTTDDKGAILTEVFQVSGDGNFSGTISVPDVYRDDELVTKVAVTMEDAAMPQAHTGSIAMATQL